MDAGAYGVICPMINTEAEARALVQYSKYRTKGNAATPCSRPGLYGRAAAYTGRPPRTSILMQLLETQDGDRQHR